MNNHHALLMAKTKFPRGLRIIECEECRYAFAVEINQQGIIDLDTKVQINEGDQQASHSFFQAPIELPTIDVSMKAEPYPTPF